MLLGGVSAFSANYEPWSVEDCATTIAGTDVLRIRNSQFRVKLSNGGVHFARRFADYAAMSAAAYDYAENSARRPCKGTRRADDRWVQHLQIAGWEETTERILGEEDRCEEDNRGFYARTWQRTTENGDRFEVVIAFRGTTDLFLDSLFGNLYWFLEDVVADDQYEKAVELLRRMLEHYGDRDVLIRTVGHSLGGGLAQHALYAKPGVVSQAVVFHPSPVTGYFRYQDTDQAESERRRRLSCSAMPTVPDEARIYRIYESGEFLAYVRFLIKVVNPLSRHINEIRTNFDDGMFMRGHSMKAMAGGLVERAGGASREQPVGDWLASEPGFCGGLFRALQASLYDLPNQTNVCPSKP